MIPARNERPSEPIAQANPLLQVLPREMNYVELADWLNYVPPPPLRLSKAMVELWLKSFMVVTKHAVQIVSSMLELMELSAIHQDPRISQNRARILNVEEILSTITIQPTIALNASGILITGVTALGKSHTVSHALARIPQIVEHGHNSVCNWHELRQLVHLTVPLAGDGTPKAFYIAAIHAIDSALGTNYSAELKDSYGVARLLIFFMHKLLLHRVLILVIEEAQKRNLNLKIFSETFESLFLGLLNFGIPVVLIGHPEGTAPVLQWGQISRRICKGGLFRLEPVLRWKSKLWKDDYVPGIWKPTPLHLPDEEWCVPELLPRELWIMTAGFPGFLADLRALSIKSAINRGSPRVEKLDIDEAYQSVFFAGVRPIVEAFVAHDAVALKNFRDMDVDHYASIWQTMKVASRNASPESAEVSPEAQVQASDIQHTEADKNIPREAAPKKPRGSTNAKISSSRKRRSPQAALPADDVRSTEWLANQPKSNLC